MPEPYDQESEKRDPRAVTYGHETLKAIHFEGEDGKFSDLYLVLLTNEAEQCNDFEQWLDEIKYMPWQYFEHNLGD